MKYIPLFVIVTFCGIAGLIGSTIVMTFSKIETRYNCELAEISPDFPIKAKQECRELRIKNEKGTIQGDSTTSGQ